MQDLDLEKNWHEQNFYVDSGHWTSHPLFASRERHWLKNDIQKIRFYGYLHKYLKRCQYSTGVANLLMAPVGNGSDYTYLQGIADQIYGVDISKTALLNCPPTIVTREADILNSSYDDGSFQVVVCSQFLHHVHAVGFDPFIKEFSRCLGRGGVLAILEPSSMYPLSIIFKLLNKILGNVTGKVEGERPINPIILLKILHDNGFHSVRTIGLTNNHVRFPVFLQNIINLLDFPLRRLAPLCYLSESIGIYCQKA